MLLFTRTTLQCMTLTMAVIDWIADRLERVDDDIPEFLRPDYRTIQVRGRPRKAW